MTDLREAPCSVCGSDWHYTDEHVEPARRCIFTPCVATWAHTHGGFPGGYDNPDDPEGPPIPFEGEDPEPEAVRDYNGAALTAEPDRPSHRPTQTAPGHIYGASPWTRAALRQLRDRHPAIVERIEARIPPNGHISIGAARAPGPWNAYLVIDRLTVAEARELGTVVAAAEAVLYAWETKHA